METHLYEREEDLSIQCTAQPSALSLSKLSANPTNSEHVRFHDSCFGDRCPDSPGLEVPRQGMCVHLR